MSERIIAVFVFAILGHVNFSNGQSDKKVNTCKTWDDYYHMEENPNCWYNPDIDLDTVGFAQKHGYPTETYTVTTKDGYILTVFRLPVINPKAVVFLQHPAITCSSVWVDKGNLSLAFQLFDAGYDVWLGNARGDRFSRKHVTLSPDEPEFWDHSFHEIALYDTPVQLELIRKISSLNATAFNASTLNASTFNKESPNIVYIGHSLGGTVGVLYPILYPEEAPKMLKAVIAMGAGLQYKYIQNQLSSILLDNSNFFLSLAKAFNQMEIFSPAMSTIYKSFCRDYGAGVEFCAISFNWLVGSTGVSNQMVPEWYPQIFSQHPSGVSFKVFVHYFQQAKSKRFQYFDYDPGENLKRYNSSEPPLYRLEDMSVPIHFISGDKDALCTARDVQEMYEGIPRKFRFGHKVFRGFNHIDFVYGRNVNLVNKHVLDMMDKLKDVR